MYNAGEDATDAIMTAFPDEGGYKGCSLYAPLIMIKDFLRKQIVQASLKKYLPRN